MKFKKASLLFATVCLGAALLVGCGSDSDTDTAADDDVDAASVAAEVDADVEEDTAAAVSVDALFDTVSAANPISNPRDLDDITIELDFMLSMDDVAAYKGIASNDGGDAGMVIVIEAVDSDAADAITEALVTYADNQVLFWGNYEEFEDAKASVEDSRIKRDGNFIIQVFASNEADYTDIETALVAAFN